MSKSKGNFYTLRDLLEKGHNALTIRYALLQVQYRKQLNFSMDGLEQAQRSLDRIKEFLFRMKTAKVSPGLAAPLQDAVTRARAAFEAGLDDDLNTSQALASIFELIRECNIALDREQLQEDNRTEILQWFSEVDRRLAIVPPVDERGESDAEIDALVAQRNEARRSRNFAEADRIRKELLDLGILIEDTREGTKWRRR
jgi:cysteinyl-tRNA synthetase